VSGPLTDRQSEKLDRIRASTAHLLTVIEEILTFSRVEAGKEDMHAEPVDAIAIAREAISMLEPVAARKGLDFTANLPATHVTVVTDAVKLRQVMLNLLGNAIKFTDVGSIEVGATASRDSITFVVSDTGCGIARSHHERIFEAFWQAESGVTRRVGGTGLGLTVCRQLVDLMGGRIDVESEQGAGSTFRVTLPRKR
jgi:signal transduction histidine kinase